MGLLKGQLSEEELARRAAVLEKHARGEPLLHEEANLYEKEKQRRHMLEVRSRVPVDVGGASGSGAASGTGSGLGHQAGV